MVDVVLAVHSARAPETSLVQKKEAKSGWSCNVSACTVDRNLYLKKLHNS